LALCLASYTGIPIFLDPRCLRIIEVVLHNCRNSYYSDEGKAKWFIKSKIVLLYVFFGIVVPVRWYLMFFVAIKVDLGFEF